jgi:N-acetylglutamate synthase/N-acetylornithine aminotransferase
VLPSDLEDIVSKTRAEQADLFTQQAVTRAIVDTERRMRAENDRLSRVIVEQERQIVALSEREAS